MYLVVTFPCHENLKQGDKVHQRWEPFSFLLPLASHQTFFLPCHQHFKIKEQSIKWHFLQGGIEDGMLVVLKLALSVRYRWYKEPKLRLIQACCNHRDLLPFIYYYDIIRCLIMQTDIHVDDADIGLILLCPGLMQTCVFTCLPHNLHFTL